MSAICVNSWKPLDDPPLVPVERAGGPKGPEGPRRPVPGRRRRLRRRSRQKPTLFRRHEGPGSTRRPGAAGAYAGAAGKNHAFCRRKRSPGSARPVAAPGLNDGRARSQRSPRQVSTIAAPCLKRTNPPCAARLRRGIFAVICGAGATRRNARTLLEKGAFCGVQAGWPRWLPAAWAERAAASATRRGSPRRLPSNRTRGRPASAVPASRARGRWATWWRLSAPPRDPPVKLRFSVARAPRGRADR